MIKQHRKTFSSEPNMRRKNEAVIRRKMVLPRRKSKSMPRQSICGIDGLFNDI